MKVARANQNETIIGMRVPSVGSALRTSPVRFVTAHSAAGVLATQPATLTCPFQVPTATATALSG